MKTRICFLLVLTTTLAALSAAPVFAAPPAKQAFARSVGSVERFGHTLFTRGSSKSQVERSLGAPKRKLNAEVWVYANFRSESDESGPRRGDDCSTLLITFTEGRVSDLKLVNQHAERIIAAQLRANQADKMQVVASDMR